MVTVSLCLFSCGKEEVENSCYCDFEGHYVTSSFAGTGEMNLTRNGGGSFSLSNTGEYYDEESVGSPLTIFAWDNEIIGSAELIGCDSIRITFDARNESLLANDSTEIVEWSGISDLVIKPCYLDNGLDRGCDTLCIYIPEIQNVMGIIEQFGVNWIRQ